MNHSDRLSYPALFHIADDGGFWVTFPDLPECMTQGEDLREAYTMAVDALGLCLDSREDLPAPSAPDAILHDADTFVVLVEIQKGL